MKTLTIGIPVYNGYESIGRTLDSIEKALENCSRREEISVIISDNASTDKTYEIIQKYNSFVTYYKNSTNLGYDTNVDKVVNLSESEYIWLLGSGDLITIESLNELFSLLNSEVKPDIAFANFNIFSEDHNKITNDNFYKLTANCCLNYLEYLDKYKVSFLAFSQIIIKKSIWTNNKLVLKCDGWIHVEKLLDIMVAYNSNIAISGNILMTLYQESDGWWKNGNKALLNFLMISKILVYSNLKANKKNYRKLMNFYTGKPLLFSIIYSKNLSLSLNKDCFKSIFLFFKEYPFRSTFFTLLLLIPNFFYKILRHKVL